MYRYTVKAKRRNTNEPFTDWANAQDYYKAVSHAVKVAEAGYDGQIIVHPEVKEIWEILGDGNNINAVEVTDKIFDAGFRKASVIRAETKHGVTKKIFKEINKILADKSGPDLRTALEEFVKKYKVGE